MVLKAVLDSVEGLPQELADEYEERDGKFHLIPPEGFKPLVEFNKVHGALQKERKDHGVVKAKLTAFGDLEPEQVRVQLDRIPELEAAAEGKLDDTKINNIVENRVKQKLAPVERELQTIKGERDELKNKVTEFESKDITRSLQDTVRAAATKAGVQPAAIDDALMLAERFLEKDESGQFVVKAGAANYTPGVSAEVWLTQVKDTRPHWWGDSGGGGARGSGGSNKGGSNPWSDAGWNMTEQAKIYTENPTRADQLAKAAGTRIGGPRPVAKK